jgi:hypothetical protein
MFIVLLYFNFTATAWTMVKFYFIHARINDCIEKLLITMRAFGVSTELVIYPQIERSQYSKK